MSVFGIFRAHGKMSVMSDVRDRELIDIFFNSNKKDMR
jgi:hypothetical protein